MGINYYECLATNEEGYLHLKGNLHNKTSFHNPKNLLRAFKPLSITYLHSKTCGRCCVQNATMYCRFDASG